MQPKPGQRWYGSAYHAWLQLLPTDCAGRLTVKLHLPNGLLVPVHQGYSGQPSASHLITGSWGSE
jgi:hypothetical protein